MWCACPDFRHVSHFFFSDMLAKNTALECLALGDAELGDSGVTSLCAGLATNTALREIELDYKGLTSVGAAALAGLIVPGCVTVPLCLCLDP